MATIRKAKKAMSGRAAQISAAEKRAIGGSKKKTSLDATKKKYDFSASGGKSIDQMRREALARRKKNKKM